MVIKTLLYLYAFSFSFLLAILIIPIVKRFAIKYKILAYPHKERLHSVPIPVLGGVAIVGTFYLSLLLHYALFYFFPDFLNLLPTELQPYLHGVQERLYQLGVILFGGGVIFLLGLFDDLKGLGPKVKLLLEILVAIFLYYNHIRVSLFLEPSFFSLLITVLWVVGITNAFNLLDNIDGLSAGVALIASFILLLLCCQGGQILVSLLLIIFMGSLAGFLKHNYPPASIFMGDAGSLFIGYIVSVLTLLSTFYSSPGLSLVPIAAPLLILAVPIYDTFSVIWIRIKTKRSIFSGDQNHFSHRLLRLGMTTKETILLIYLIAFCLGVVALTLNSSDLKSQMILLLQAIGILAIIHLLESAKKATNETEEKTDI